jgi:DNA-binding MarR family transcriptional regulator
VLDSTFYDLTQEAGAAILAWHRRMQTRRDAPSDPLLAELRRGYAESPSWFLIQAMEFDPEPLTVASLRVRDVYASERIVGALLELMTSEDWLDRDVSDGYRLTADGRALAERLRPRADGTFLDAEVPIQGPVRVVDLLDRVIDNALRGSDPPGSWCVAHSRRRAPPVQAEPLVKLCQCIEDLNAFRDDAHMAAWRSHHVEGYEWETFALVCEGRAASATRLFECLAHRGYSRLDYAAALDQLASRGWIDRANDAEAYHVTVAGRRVRADVERRTDEYFYAAWTPLTDGEIDEIRTGLEHVRDRLT